MTIPAHQSRFALFVILAEKNLGKKLALYLCDLCEAALHACQSPWTPTFLYIKIDVCEMGGSTSKGYGLNGLHCKSAVAFTGAQNGVRRARRDVAKIGIQRPMGQLYGIG